MSQALDVNLIELFDVPVVYFDNVLTVVGMNERFGALFGSVVGVPLSDLSDDFSEKKFQRRVAASQSYACTLVPAGEQRAHFTLDVKLCDNAFIGYAVDTSAVAKSEAMLASYSDLIEKQNREIKAKTEQLNVWSKRIQNELEPVRSQDPRVSCLDDAADRPNLSQTCCCIHNDDSRACSNPAVHQRAYRVDSEKPVTKVLQVRACESRNAARRLRYAGGIHVS